jgi:hypothetical protein
MGPFVPERVVNDYGLAAAFQTVNSRYNSRFVAKSLQNQPTRRYVPKISELSRFSFSPPAAVWKTGTHRVSIKEVNPTAREGYGQNSPEISGISR